MIKYHCDLCEKVVTKKTLELHERMGPHTVLYLRIDATVGETGDGTKQNIAGSICEDCLRELLIERTKGRQ